MARGETEAMQSGAIYLIAADLILLLHVFFVAFVVFGLLLVVAGKLLGWSKRGNGRRFLLPTR